MAKYDLNDYYPRPYDDEHEDRRIAIARLLRIIRRANTSYIVKLTKAILQRHPEWADQEAV